MVKRDCMKQTIRINASALKNATCLLRFYRIVIQGYKRGINSNSIEFGSAGHLFLSQMAITKGDLAKSLSMARDYYRVTPMVIDPTKKYLDEIKLCGTCVTYWQHLQNEDTFKILDSNEGPAVEVTFSNKFYEDDEYIILLEGTIDKIGKFDNGCFAIGDYKFSSIWGSSYEDKKRKMIQYFKTHELGCQLRFYLFNLLLKANNEPEGSILKEVTKRQVGCFIDAIFHHGKDASEFKRSPIFFFSPEDMHEFEHMLKGFCANLISVLKMKSLPPRHGVLNGACGGGFHLCDFFNVCAAPSDIAREHILKNDFKQAEYLPIHEKD